MYELLVKVTSSGHKYLSFNVIKYVQLEILTKLNKNAYYTYFDFDFFMKLYTGSKN